MNWKKEYNTGIVTIDEQHRELCKMVSSLESAIDSEDAYTIMRHILKGLVNYVKYHFEDEERVMRYIGFPEYEEHKRLHKELVDQVVKILVDVKNGKEILPYNLMKFLQKWLIDHILGEDKKIGDYFYR